MTLAPTTTGPALSLADLETHDPRAPSAGVERRFCCPLCGGDKRQDAAHRSLAVDTGSGAWHCHRCHEKGKLTEWWTDRPAETFRPGRRRNVSARLSLPPRAARNDAPPEPPPAITPALPELADTPGAAYLEARGLPLALCALAGVRFAPDWYGRSAVVFPICNQAGQEVAAQGRYIDRRSDPKARTTGPKSQGVFATPGAWEADEWIVTEAPIDALSLAASGRPALALVGTSWPEWFPKACAWRHVLAAFDADQAGDDAAELLMVRVAGFGAQGERLRPVGAKDWNELRLRLTDCRRLDREIGRQVLFLQSGAAHQDFGPKVLLARARETYAALEAACASIGGDDAHGYADPLDPFADECLDRWHHALEGLR